MGRLMQELYALLGNTYPSGKLTKININETSREGTATIVINRIEFDYKWDSEITCWRVLIE